MVSCRQCGYRIKHREILAWVNSGMDSLECQGCGRKVASSAWLTFIYFIWAIAMVVAVNYRHEIAIYTQGYGIDIPGIIAVLFIGLLWVFMVCVSAFFVARWKA